MADPSAPPVPLRLAELSVLHDEARALEMHCRACSDVEASASLAKRLEAIQADARHVGGRVAEAGRDLGPVALALYYLATTRDALCAWADDEGHPLHARAAALVSGRAMRDWRPDRDEWHEAQARGDVAISTKGSIPLRDMRRFGARAFRDLEAELVKVAGRLSVAPAETLSASAPYHAVDALARLRRVVAEEVASMAAIPADSPLVRFAVERGDIGKLVIRARGPAVAVEPPAAGVETSAEQEDAEDKRKDTDDGYAEIIAHPQREKRRCRNKRYFRALFRKDGFVEAFKVTDLEWKALVVALNGGVSPAQVKHQRTAMKKRLGGLWHDLKALRYRIVEVAEAEFDSLLKSAEGVGKAA